MIKFFTGPHEVMNRNNELHYELFNFDTNIEMKVFMAILATTTMLYRTNKTEKTQRFILDGYLSNDSFLPRTSLNFKKLEKIINSFNSPFFEELFAVNKEVYFTLSKKYIEMLNNSGFNKIDLQSLKSIRDVRATKLAILTQFKPNGYFDLNYLFKVLDLNDIKRRNDRIAKIKKAFKNIDIEVTYKHPLNQNSKRENDHYKFFYKTEDKEIEDDIFFADIDLDYGELKEDANDEIDKIFNTDDLDLDFELFEKEEYEKKNKAESEITTKKTDGYSSMHKHYLGIKTNKDKHEEEYEEEYEDPDWHIPF